MFEFNHHHPLAPEFYTTVLGFTVVILLSVWFFIHYLRVGLNSSDASRVDAKK